MLDLAQLTAQLEEQLADLSRQRVEIQQELEALQLVRRASLRTDSLGLEEGQEKPPSEPEQAMIDPEEVRSEETAGQEGAIPEETAPAAKAWLENEVGSEPGLAPLEEALVEEGVQPVEVASQEQAPMEEETAQPVEPTAPEAVAPPVEVAAIEETAQPDGLSLESTAEVDDRRHKLEETVMALELSDEIAVLELLRMFQKTLPPGKIAEELAAVHWNFQGQIPREAVNAALQKLVQEGKVTQVDGGDYGLSA